MPGMPRFLWPTCGYVCGLVFFGLVSVGSSRWEIPTRRYAAYLLDDP